MSNEFNVHPDLTDPKQLAAQLDTAADGLEQQIVAADSKLPMGGHSNPRFFYQQLRQVCQAASKMIREQQAAAEQGKKEVKK